LYDEEPLVLDLYRVTQTLRSLASGEIDGSYT